jgi:hypothetical protein
MAPAWSAMCGASMLCGSLQAARKRPVPDVDFLDSNEGHAKAR